MAFFGARGGAALCLGALSAACGADNTTFGAMRDAGRVESPTEPDASVGSVAGTPSLGCRNASECRSGACVSISDGFSACAVEHSPVSADAGSGAINECDTATPCPSGACYTLAVAASNQCSPGGFDIRNVCLSDECSSDADCAAGERCSPPGVAGTSQLTSSPQRLCLPATCKADADCTAKPGGVCGLVQAQCTGASVENWGFRGAEVACVYPDGCTQLGDCPNGHYCSVVGGAAVCLSR
jgi:hypothetical protein